MQHHHHTPNRVDEMLHLTAAFLLAGYANVVGTLWPVDDQAAASLTDAFYTALTSGGNRPPLAACAARALHRATVAGRDAKPDDPRLWAAHIHVGI